MPNLPENCPICGEKMEEGYMLSSGNIFWSKEKKTRITRWSEERLIYSLFRPTRFHVANVE
ncbi:MAG: PF20097 family protein, partial [Nitrososphaerota archaeon]